MVEQSVQEYGFAAGKVWLKTERALTAGGNGVADDSDDDEAGDEKKRKIKKWAGVITKPLGGLTSE